MMVLKYLVKPETLPNSNHDHIQPHQQHSPHRTNCNHHSVKSSTLVIRTVFAVAVMIVLVQSILASSSSYSQVSFQSLYDDVTTGLILRQQYDSITTARSMIGIAPGAPALDLYDYQHHHYQQDYDWFFKTLLPTRGAGHHGIHNNNNHDDGTTVSCERVQEHLRSGDWIDPNDGRLFLRQVITKPSFYISVHNQEYDSLRYKTIFQTGDYYEVEVRQRFEYILNENQHAWGNKYHLPSSNENTSTGHLQRMPIVMDVGGNIGYYTLLSAAWKHAVVTFEINPSNIIRLCESLNFGGQQSLPISIHRQGVSNVTGATIQVTVAKNPGATSLVRSKKYKPLLIANSTEVQVFAVSTITLDEFAKQNHWLEQQPPVHVSLLKLDTEGHEPQILQGAQQVIQKQLAKNILVEFRPHCQQAMVALLDAGYAIVDDSNDSKRFLSRKEALAFLEEESERVRLKKSWDYSDLWFRLQTLPFLT